MYGLRGLGAEAMGPPVDPNVPVESPDVQQQIADVWSYLFEQPGQVAIAPTPGASASSFTQTLNANAGKIAIGAGVFLALVLFAKAGR
jgi:hypothetical protein